MTTGPSTQLMHLANFNSTNVGNGALFDGLEATLTQDFPSQIDWVREAWDDYTFGRVDFDGNFVDRVNALDGLIVGGAVTFNGRDYNHLTGSRFELPFERWDDIRQPVIFYGLSYRHWPGQTYHHRDRLQQMIHRILTSDRMLLSVRNDGTRRWISELCGIDESEIIEVPDSGLYVRTDRQVKHRELSEHSCNLMIAFNDEDRQQRYDAPLTIAGRCDRSRSQVIASLASAVTRLAEDCPLNLILCPHYFDDFRMISDFVEQLPPALAHQCTVATGLSRAMDSASFYARYQQADLVISMRVHSMSPCIGLGTPMIAYTTQARMTDFLEDVDLSEFSVDAFDPAASDQLVHKLRQLLADPEHVRRRFGVACERMRTQTRLFHSRIASLLKLRAAA